MEMGNVSKRQVSSDLELNFMVHWTMLSFCNLVYISDTISNMATIDGVW